MKRTLRTLMGMALIVSAMIANAGMLDDHFKIEVVGDKSFNLIVRNITGIAEISIRDTKGLILFSDEMIGLNEFNRSFDLSNLPAGSYELEYSDDFKIQTVDLSVGKTLTFTTNDKDVYFKPAVSLKNDILSVGMLTGPDNRFTISVFDKSDNLLVFKTIKGKEYNGKQFDLSQIPAGQYRVVVRNRGKAFTNYFNI